MMNHIYKVLIIDDDIAPFEGHIRLLKSQGYHVETAKSGNAGLALALEFQPHLIILDIILPDIDGFEVCNQIKSNYINTNPFIMIISAGMTEPNSFIKGFEIGADDYITKPITKEVLLARINAIFRSIKAEKALFDEKEKLYVTLKSIGDGVITTDIDGKIVMLNYSAEKMTGWSQIEAFGKPVEDVFYIVNEQTRIRCENPIERVLKTERIIGLANNTALISKDGTERIIADSGAPIFDSNNKIIGAVLVFQDITERILLESQIHHAQKLESIGVFAGGIAHDFNNILGVITGNLSYARGLINSNEEVFDVLSDIETSAKQAQRLTHQLLTFSKGGAPIKKVMSIPLMIQDTVNLVIRGSNIQCKMSIPDDIWTVKGDKGQLGQVISNIIINAKQAMPEGGTIELQVENTIMESNSIFSLSTGHYVKITIKDNGIGISKKHISKIFDPYFSTKQEGSGLGLASSFSIIKKHDGHISVESVLDQGTTFYIFLPATTEQIKEPEDEIIVQHKGQGRILIMDDQEPILKMVSKMLKSMGYEAVLTIDGKKAVEAYQEAYQAHKPFDLVILDLTVPAGMGGAKAIIELLKIDANVKAVVSSGYSNDPIMANYNDYGFCGVMPKPYTKKELTKVLNEVLGIKTEMA